MTTGGPISLEMVRAIRHAAKPKGIRIVWAVNGLLKLYFPSGRKLHVRSEDDAREIRAAIEREEL